MALVAAWGFMEWATAAMLAASVVAGVGMGRGWFGMAQPQMPNMGLNLAGSGNGAQPVAPTMPAYATTTAPAAGSSSGQSNTMANSPTYGWDGIRNTSHTGAPPPLVYGAHRVAGLILNVYKESLGDKQALNMLIAVGEGEISSISSIEINRNPIQNYHDVSYETRVGTNDQSPIPYFGDIVTEYSQNAKVTVGGFIYTSRGAGIQAVEVFVEFPNGLYAVDGKDDTLNYIADLGQEVINLGGESEKVNNRIAVCNDNLAILSQTISNYNNSIADSHYARSVIFNALAAGCPINRNDYPDNLQGYMDYMDDVARWTENMNEGIAWHDRNITNKTEAIADAETAIKNIQSQLAGYNRDLSAVSGQSRSIQQQQLNSQRTLNKNQYISRSVTWRLEYRRKGQTAWTLHGDSVVIAASKSPIRRSVRINNLPAGQYDIRVSRVTPESTSFRIIDDMFMTAVDEIIYDDLAYPNTALLGIRAIATDQLNGSMPNVTCVVHGKKIKVWNGSAWATVWSNNPVWIVYDLLTNTRYGMGVYVAESQIDLQSFYEAAQWCDEPVSDNAGGLEKRCQWDGVIDANPGAWDLLNQICSTFGGSIIYTGGVYKVRVARPALPVQMFTMGNIIAGSFSQSVLSSDKHINAVEVQHTDAAQNWAMDMALIETRAAFLNNEPVRKQSISLVGVTRRSQAIREAHRALNVARLIQRRISFSVGVDALACETMDVISFSHDVPQWGFSGRALRSIGRRVQLDKPVTMTSGKSYALRVRYWGSDTVQEIPVVLDVGTTDWVTATADWTEPVTGGDLYSFGEIGNVTKQFRIHSISRDSDLTRKIEAWEYNPDVWVYDTVVSETPNVSSLSNPFGLPTPVTDLRLSERLFLDSAGQIGVAMDIWFNPSPDSTDYIYDHADIFYSVDFGASWVKAASTASNHYAVFPVTEGRTYLVAVSSVGLKGATRHPADSPQAELLIAGKTVPPSAPTNFTGIQQNGNVFLSWTPATDLDVAGYAIREGVTWDSGLPVADYITGASVNLPVTVNATYRYWIKTFDTTGHYSTPVGCQVVVSGLPCNILFTRDELTLHDGTASDLVYLSELGGLINPSAVKFDDIPTRTFQDAALSALLMEGKTSHSYTTTVYDQGRVAKSNITLQLSIDSTDVNASFQTYPAWTFQTHPSETFQDISGEFQTSAEINTSDDNVTWTGWQQFTPGAYTFRYVKWRLTITSSVTSRVLVTSMVEIIDVPDIKFWVTGFSVGIGGSTLTFPTYGHTLFTTPNLAVTPVGAGFALPVVSAKSASSATIVLYDAAGASIAGTVDAFIQGW